MSLEGEYVSGPLAMSDEASAAKVFIVLVNARAGEVLQQGEAAFASSISNGFSACGVTCDVRFIAPRKLAHAVQTAIAEKPDALLVAGGDGTVNRLLGDLVAADIPIGLLPLGTLNLLARDVGLEGALEAVLPRLARGTVQSIDLADVNGNLFHSNAGLGFFARMAREREDARQTVPSSKRLGFAVAAMRSLWFHRPITIDLSVNGIVETHEADALLVTNNHFDGSEWRRDRLDSGLLEIHMLKAAGMLARLRAAIAVYRGTWRELPHLQSVTASTVTVRRRGKARSTMSLDGEIYRVRNPINFVSKPAALELLTGRDQP